MSLSEASNFQTMQGLVTLTATVPVVVLNANVRRSSQIILTVDTVHTACLGAYVKDINPGVSFTVCGQATDVSDYDWIILNYPRSY